MQLGVVFYPGKADNCRTILPMAKQIKMRVMHNLNIKDNSFDIRGDDVGVQVLRISINIDVNVD